MTLAPIVLFVYNRPYHTRRTVEALAKNHLADKSDLFIFSDGPKNTSSANLVFEVRNFLREVRGFKSVVVQEREGNFGLANSVIFGVTEVLKKYEKVIVLEDDLVTSPFFLRYMNEALDLYSGDDRVVSVHGYVYPVAGKLPETFFVRGADCWGWGTWRRGWSVFKPNALTLWEGIKQANLSKQFDLNGSYPYTLLLKMQSLGFSDSWAIRWHASAFLQNKLTLYPGVSLVSNIGFDSSGTHTGSSSAFKVMLSDRPLSVDHTNVTEDVDAVKLFEGYFRSWPLCLIKWKMFLLYWFKVISKKYEIYRSSKSER